MPAKNGFLICCWLLFSLALASCAGRRENFYFPLKSGISWEYQAEYQTGLGEKKIKFPPLDYTLTVSSEEPAEEFLGYQLKLFQAGEYYESFALLKQPRSGDIYLKGGQILLSFPLWKGKSWRAEFRGEDFSFKVRKKEKLKTLLGDFNCWQISFKSNQEKGRLWLADGIGMVALQYQSQELAPAGAADWELKKVSGL